MAEKRLDPMVKAVVITSVILFAFWALSDGSAALRSGRTRELGLESRLFFQLLGLAFALDVGILIISLRILITRKSVMSLLVATAAYACVETLYFTQEIPAMIARVQTVMQAMEDAVTETAVIMRELAPTLIVLSLVPTLLRIASSVLLFVLLFRATRKREVIAL